MKTMHFTRIGLRNLTSSLQNSSRTLIPAKEHPQFNIEEGWKARKRGRRRAGLARKKKKKANKDEEEGRVGEKGRTSFIFFFFFFETLNT